MDFVIEYNGLPLPIEVKSGKDYKTHSALNNCLNNTQYNMNEGIVFANCNVQKDDKILYLPAYMVMFLDRKDEENLILDDIVIH